MKKRKKNSDSKFNPDYSLHLVAMFLRFSLIWNHFSLSWPWHFWRVQDIYFFSKVPQFVWYFLIIRFWLQIFGRKSAEVMWVSASWLACAVSYSTGHVSLTITWSVWYHLIRFLHHKVIISPLVVSRYLVERYFETMQTPHFPWRYNPVNSAFINDSCLRLLLPW